MKILEAKTAILATKTLDELSSLVESLMDEARFPYNYGFDYNDNATLATLSCRHGVAEILILAAKREKVML